MKWPQAWFLCVGILVRCNPVDLIFSDIQLGILSFEIFRRVPAGKGCFQSGPPGRIILRRRRKAEAHYH